MGRYVTVNSFELAPTAHTPDESNATPLNAFVGLGPFGLATTAQVVPSQCSVRVRPLVEPTAQISVGDAAATAKSSLSLPDGAAFGTTAQATPS
jgi:hypothetical protein